MAWLSYTIFVTDSKKMGRTISVPKSALRYELDKGQIPLSGNLLYPSLVLPELKVGRKRVKCLLRSLMMNESDVQYSLIMDVPTLKMF